MYFVLTENFSYSISFVSKYHRYISFIAEVLLFQTLPILEHKVFCSCILEKMLLQLNESVMDAGKFEHFKESVAIFTVV